MAANIFSTQVPDPNLQSNGFDLSYRCEIEANVGELLPIFSRYTLPGDKFRVRVADLVRANAFVTSPFIRAKQHYDFYFVPKAAIWKQWLNFCSEKSDFRTAADKNHKFHPYVKATELAESLNDFATSVDIMGRNYLKGARRLMSLLRYGDTAWNKGNSSSTHDPLDLMADLDSDNADYGVNLDRIAAYNMVWYHFYRNKFYDDGSWTPGNGNNLRNPAYLFNFDDLTCDSLLESDVFQSILPLVNNGAATGNRRIASMFQMRYHQWKKDLFTGLLPSPQFGAVSEVNVRVPIGDFLTSSDSNRWVSLVDGNIPTDGAISIGGANHNNVFDSASKALKHSHMVSLSEQNGVFDIIQLRRAMAVQKYNEISLRAGTRMGDNQQAHSGVRPHFNDQLLPTYLGSLSAPLNIQDINATAATDGAINGSVGDVAGKGIMSFDGEAFKFNANDDGIIIGIYYILPEAEYNNRGVDRENCLLEHDDFFNHEFQNIGMEAVSGRNFDFQHNAVIGYAPRYYAYKCAIDYVTGQFQNDDAIKGVLSHWVSPRQYYNVVNGITLRSLYVDPQILDTVFAQSVDGVPASADNSAYDYYQFFVNIYHDVKAIRQMSVLGLPEI